MKISSFVGRFLIGLQAFVLATFCSFFIFCNFFGYKAFTFYFHLSKSFWVFFYHLCQVRLSLFPPACVCWVNQRDHTHLCLLH